MTGGTPIVQALKRDLLSYLPCSAPPAFLPHRGELLHEVSPQRAAEVNGGIGLLERNAQHPALDIDMYILYNLFQGTRHFTRDGGAGGLSCRSGDGETNGPGGREQFL